MACQGTAETSTESPTSIETKCQSSVNSPYIFIVVLTVIFIIFVFYLFSLIKVFLSLFLIFNVTMHPNELLSKILILIANQDRCLVTLLIDLFFFFCFYFFSFLPTPFSFFFLSFFFFFFFFQNFFFFSPLLPFLVFFFFFYFFSQPPPPPHFFVLFPPLFCQLCPLLFPPLHLCLSVFLPAKKTVKMLTLTSSMLLLLTKTI